MGVWEAPPIPVVPGRGLVGARPDEVPAAVIVSVVNPTLNEAANIGWLLERLPGAMRRAAREPALAGTQLPRTGRVVTAIATFGSTHDAD